MSYVKKSSGIATVRSVYGNIKIELSVDNGSTFPYTANASYDCGAFDPEDPDRTVSIPVTIPDATGTQCYFRYTSLDVSGVVWLSGLFQITDVTAQVSGTNAAVGMAVGMI